MKVREVLYGLFFLVTECFKFDPQLTHVSSFWWLIFLLAHSCRARYVDD